MIVEAPANQSVEGKDIHTQQMQVEQPSEDQQILPTEIPTPTSARQVSHTSEADNDDDIAPSYQDAELQLIGKIMVKKPGGAMHICPLCDCPILIYARLV